MYRKYWKRAFDLSVSLVGFIVLLPVFVLVFLVLVFLNGGKALFIQSRPGKDEKPFDLIKFKTMSDKTDAHGKLLRDHLRITKLGAFLRRSSLDELPQLINVIKGDMSLVGPRPLLFRYISLYTPDQLRRHAVRPGITGWAQVNGRNTISWSRKFELDIYYIDHVSFLLDIDILFKTFLKVLKSDDVNADRDTPMYPFDGTN